MTPDLSYTMYPERSIRALLFPTAGIATWIRVPVDRKEILGGLNRNEYTSTSDDVQHLANGVKTICV